MKSKLAVLAAVLTLASASAQAAEWWWVAATSDNGGIFYADRRVRTEVIGQRTIRLVWAELHFVAPTKYGTAVVKTLEQFDCSQREAATKASHDYTRNGEHLRGGTIPKVRYEPVIPGTNYELLLRFACNAERGAGKAEFTVQGSTFYRVEDPAEDALKEWAAPKAP